MASSQVLPTFLVVCFLISLFIHTDSLSTSYGRRKIHDRQKRAAAGYPVPTATAQARYQQPSYPAGQNSYPQQQSTYRYPQQAATYQRGQQVPLYNNPQSANQFRQQQYANPATGGAAYAQRSPNPAYSGGSALASLYSANLQNPQFAAQGYDQPPQPTQAAYPATNNQAQFSYPTGAYPVNQQGQNGYQGAAGQNGYPNFQGAASSPQQYNYNGYNPYANQQMGNQGYGNNAGYQQGRAAPTAAPVMVTPPSAQQYTLVEFCKQREREPKCKKNSFGMCDSQENYPSDVANEFYGFYKSRITAMATDYDYSNSDQYDTGFASQQNKLIDFVHEIFEDNEYGNLPGVPPVKKGLCVENSDILQPGWAKTSRGRYTVIMNSNNIKQTVRAGICKNAGKGCQDVPKCYKSECRQRFRYDTLLVFDPCDAKKPPMLELFKIPDGCECFVLQDEPDLTAPLTSDQDATKGAQTTKQNAKGRSGDFATAALIKATNEIAATTARIPTIKTVPTTLASTAASTAAKTEASTVTTTVASTSTTTTPASTVPTAAPTTLESATSGGIPPRSSLVLAPRASASIPINSESSDLKAL